MQHIILTGIVLDVQQSDLNEHAKAHKRHQQIVGVQEGVARQGQPFEKAWRLQATVEITRPRVLPLVQHLMDERDIAVD